MSLPFNLLETENGQKKSGASPKKLTDFVKLVPGAGLEPAQCYHRGILSPLRLPISPPGQAILTLRNSIANVVEAGAGIEPTYTALQAAA
jgi:hypothetical protein